MTAINPKLRSRRWYVTIICAVIFYLVCIRWLLFGYLFEHDMMDWYGSLIDAFNKFTKSSHGQGAHPLEEYRQRTDIFFLQLAVCVVLVATLKYILQSKERTLLLAINMLLLCLVLVPVEYFLRTDAMQRKIGGVKYIQLDRAINEAHIENQNTYGFTDRERSKQGNGKALRIVVMGDSFVWGDGMADLDDVWNRRLEAKLIARYGDAVEVMSWGKRGWATYGQLEFLKGPGSEFDFDFLVVGYVSNDPHIWRKSMPRRLFIWQKIAKRVVPFIDNVVLLVSTTTNNLIYSLPYFKNWGYEGWKHALYSDENLKNYESILRELQAHLRSRGIDYVFVITPTMRDMPFDDEFDALLALFDRLGLPYLDLRPAVQAAFGGYSSAEIREKLWANPADGHPGTPLHELYAEETYNFLLKRDMPIRMKNSTE